MAELFESLARICRDHLLREKILVVPSLAIGHQIADRIAHAGTSWVNLRPETIRTLADAVTGSELAAAGLTVLSRAQALGVVEAACGRVAGRAGTALPRAAEAAAPHSQQPSYFGGLADRPGLHRAIQRSLDDLRLAGATAASIAPEAFEEPRKGEELRRILEAYEEELDRGRFVDRAGVLARAVASLTSGGPRPWSADALWIVIEQDDQAVMEQRLVQLAASGDAVILGQDSEKRGGSDFRFLRGLGEENELRATFRSILGEKAPFDSAELAYTVREPYLPLAFELAAEYEIPATFAEGIAATFTRPGQAAVALLRWVASWEDAHLRRIAQAGGLAFESGAAASAASGRGSIASAAVAARPEAAEAAAPHASPTQGQPRRVPHNLSGPAFARVLRESMIGWGRERHLERVDAWIATRTAELEEREIDEAKRAMLEGRVAQGRQVRETLAALMSATEGVAPSIELASLASILARLVDGWAAVKGETDGMAKKALCRMLGELAAVPEEPVAIEEAAARLLDAIRALHVASSNPRPGHLHVAPVRAAGWSGRPRLFIAGLDEAKHPGAAMQDPVLLDAERERINAAIAPRSLPLLADRPHRVAQELLRLIARSGAARVTLSYPGLDLHERRERFPAQALLEVWRDARGTPAAGYDELAGEIESSGFVPEESALTMSEWWLGRSAGRDSVLEAHPWLAAGAEAGEARASDRITRWDGKIEAPPEEIDPRLADRIYSASQLEQMARCPYAYFLGRILRIEPLEVAEREEEWLSALEYGTLFHTVLERFMREVCARGEKPSLAAHDQRLGAIANEELEKKAREVPPPSRLAFDARRDDLVAACGVFLRIEEKECGEIDAKFFEVGFGDARAADDGISLREPLTLPLGAGRSIRLRGFIDRVDHHPASDTWHVWDYKSGSTWEYDKGGTLAAGTKVQHAIYARALEEMLERRGIAGRVAKSGYYFPTLKGRGLRNERVTPSWALESAMNLLFDAIRSGYFPHADAERCKFCDFAPICGTAAAAAERAAVKHGANPDDPAVSAWRKLQEAE